MKNNPRNLIYFQYPDPSNHRVLEKRKIFERSLTHASSYTSVSDHSHSRSVSTRKIESVTPSRLQTPVYRRRGIFELNIKDQVYGSRSKHLQLHKFKTTFQPATKSHHSPRKDWLTERQFKRDDLKKERHFQEIARLLNGERQTNNEQHKSIYYGDRSYSLASNISPQPGKTLFLCKNCFEYFPVFQERVHNKNCLFLGTRQQYVQKWKKLRQLLTEAYHFYGDSLAGRVAAEMENEEDQIALDYDYYIFHQQQTRSHLFSRRDLKWVLQELIIGMRTGKTTSKKNSFFAWMKCGQA